MFCFIFSLLMLYVSYLLLPVILFIGGGVLGLIATGNLFGGLITGFIGGALGIWASRVIKNNFFED